VGKFDVKLRYVLPAVFFAAAVVCGYFSFQVQYVYSTNSIDTSRPSEVMIAKSETEKVFGRSNQMAILIPYGDYGLEKQVIDIVAAHNEVSDALGISNAYRQNKLQTVRQPFRRGRRNCRVHIPRLRVLFLRRHQVGA